MNTLHKSKEVNMSNVPCMICGLTEDLVDPNKPRSDQKHIWDKLNPKLRAELRKLNLKYKNVALEPFAKEAMGLNL